MALIEFLDLFIMVEDFFQIDWIRSKRRNLFFYDGIDKYILFIIISYEISLI